MPQYVYSQIYCLLIFVLTGIIISIGFDIFRVFRKSFKTSDLVTYVEDILFCSFAGFLLLFVILKFNSGEIRGYIFIGLLLGIILYMLTISRYFIKYNVKIILFFKKIFNVIFEFIYNILNKILVKPIYFVVFNIKKIFLSPVNLIKSSKNYKKH